MYRCENEGCLNTMIDNCFRKTLERPQLLAEESYFNYIRLDLLDAIFTQKNFITSKVSNNGQPRNTRHIHQRKWWTMQDYHHTKAELIGLRGSNILWSLQFKTRYSHVCCQVTNLKWWILEIGYVKMVHSYGVTLFMTKCIRCQSKPL